MSSENDEKEKNKDNESNLKIELIDSVLVKGLIVSACVYFFSYSIFSLLFGNAFGGAIATPLSAISFFLTSRWDRLRDSKEVSLQNLKNLFKFTKINIKILLLGVAVIYFIQLVAGIILGFFDNSDFLPENYTDILDHIEQSNLLVIGVFIAFYLSYLIGGYVSAGLAINKSLSPYIHAISSSLCCSITSYLISILLIFITLGELYFPFSDEEVSVGAKVLFFSQFIFLPLIGAKLAVFTFNKEKAQIIAKTENDKKAKEEYTELLASEIKRLKTEEKKRTKKKTVSSSRKKK